MCWGTVKVIRETIKAVRSSFLVMEADCRSRDGALLATTLSELPPSGQELSHACVTGKNDKGVYLPPD